MFHFFGSDVCKRHNGHWFEVRIPTTAPNSKNGIHNLSTPITQVRYFFFFKHENDLLEFPHCGIITFTLPYLG